MTNDFPQAPGETIISYLSPKDLGGLASAESRSVERIKEAEKIFLGYLLREDVVKALEGTPIEQLGLLSLGIDPKPTTQPGSNGINFTDEPLGVLASLVFVTNQLVTKIGAENGGNYAKNVLVSSLNKGGMHSELFQTAIQQAAPHRKI
jgi:hypothetical protein